MLDINTDMSDSMAKATKMLDEITRDEPMELEKQKWDAAAKKDLVQQRPTFPLALLEWFHRARSIYWLLADRC